MPRIGAATREVIHSLGEEQRVGGEVDAACVTLEHTFALGMTVNHGNDQSLEFLTFEDNARCAVLDAKSENMRPCSKKRSPLCCLPLQ